MHLKKIDERNKTCERWILYELEIPWGATKLIIQYNSSLHAELMSSLKKYEEDAEQ